MTSSHPLPVPCQWFSWLAAALDRRSAPRLALLFLGAVLARGRRTVTCWIRAAKLSDQFRTCYTAVAAAGKRADRIARRLLTEVVEPMVAGAGRLVLAVDDTPTERYGPHVQGAGVHHNPTPGPAGSPYVYGHVFVVLGLLVAHPAWGVIALPLLARLYVRKVDLPGIDPKHRPPFRTKLELAVELLRWAKPWLGLLGKPIWVVADGAYAKKELLKPAKALGMTVVSRLRKDAALRSVPGPKPPGRRGPAPTYGDRRIDLAKRAGQRRGWTTEEFTLYGERVTKRYKTFLATWHPAGGLIRVVLVDEPAGWRAYFCTEASASVAEILEAVADRFSLEIAFRDCKEVVGGGPAAGAVRVGERRRVPHLPVDVHAGRGVGVGPAGGGAGGPLGVAVGLAAAPPEPRRQAAGVASGAAGRGNSCGSTWRDDRRGDSGRRRAAAQPGCIAYMKSRKVQFATSGTP
jgi:hypothetical protein